MPSPFCSGVLLVWLTAWVLLVINTFPTTYCLATYVKSNDLFKLKSRRYSEKIFISKIAV